ncbi:MAG TPA: hypothetical protein VJG48_03130 [Candidatus Paceibacterota bacterium]
MLELAQNTGTYTYLEPLDSKDGIDVTKDGGLAYFSTVYSYALTLAVGLAFVMIVVGGIQYSTSFADPGAKKAGLDRIYSAITGLVLALVSYLILNTINPNLVNPGSLIK